VTICFKTAVHINEHKTKKQKSLKVFEVPVDCEAQKAVACLAYA